MAEPQQEPVSWHYVWLRVLTQAYQHGRNVEQANSDADAAVAAYRQRLAEDGKEVTMTEQRKRSYLPWCDSCLWFAPFGNDVGSGKCHAYGPMIAADPEQPDWPVVMGHDKCPRHETAKQEESSDD